MNIAGSLDTHEQHSNKQDPQLQHSYAQMLDPNEGTELKFIPSSNIRGIQCTKIEKSDVADEIEYWQNAVLCAVMGANPPFEIMKGFLTVFGPILPSIAFYMCAREFSLFGSPT